MRTPKECKEVCEVYNISPQVARKYVQYGEVFNLLHAAASYLRIHQKGFGAVGVSNKYGKRSLARYPIFWGLTKIGKLPNPDPTDTGEFSGAISKDEEIPIDREFEAGRAELKRQAQEWAGLAQNPAADLMVFVGRWSMQKGVDLIADIMPAVLEEYENVQLICIGPVIDLYGKFAALKLEKLMKIYPGRVYSKPEFTALPPYIFSGAEFALIPSRDEPFGLVAVEFGRKGALGVGARVGGLGQMPGWWYTVESTSTTHLIHQFKTACKEALSSKAEVRARMRARSAKQRFPVVKWVEGLETLQTTAINTHHKENTRSLNHSRPTSEIGTPSGYLTPNRVSGLWTPSGVMTPSRPSTSDSAFNTRPHTPTLEDMAELRRISDPYMAIRQGPHGAHVDDGYLRPANALQSRIGYAVTDHDDPDYGYDSTDPIDEYAAHSMEVDPQLETPSAIGRPSPHGLGLPPILAQSDSPHLDDHLLPPNLMSSRHHLSTLSLDSVVGARKDFLLQKVDPFFTDSTGEFYQAFEKKLDVLDGKSSEDQLCIEDYLVKSERKWFDKFRDAKLGKSPAATTPASSVFRMKRDLENSPPELSYVPQHEPEDDSSADDRTSKARHTSNQFLLAEDYVPPKGLRKLLQARIGDWPLYSFLLAFVSSVRRSGLCFGIVLLSRL